jgi:uncharacterized protein
MPSGALIFVLLFLCVAAGLCIAFVITMALLLLRPKRMTDGRAMLLLRRLSPGDLGMEYEEVSFQVIDECTGRKLKIAGWWMPNGEAGGRCAVIVHGYSDAKVGGIAWAPLLKSLGFAILAIDLRAHGESGGVYSTAGFWERHDLNQVIDQVKLARPAETRQILLFGISLGAAVSAATAVMRNDLLAVILEGPFAVYRHAAFLEADRIGTPGRRFQEPAFRLAQWLSGADFDAVRPIDTIPKVPCPLMVVQAGDDPFLSEDDRAAVRRAVESRGSSQSPSVCWEQPGMHHVVGMRENPQEYRRQIEDFISKALQNTIVICEK